MLPRGAWILEALGLIAVLALVFYRVRASRGALVLAREGLGRRIVVRDRGAFRELVFTSADGAVEMLQASVSRDALVSGIPYTDGLHIAALVAPRLERALFLGGGPLLVPRQFLELYPGVRVTVVEIDPAVVEVARDHFSVVPGPRLSIEIGDGRDALMASAEGSFDVIVVDAFGVGTTPRRLASAPFFALCRERLRPGGCLVVNLAGALVGPGSVLLRRVHAGIVEAFGAASVVAFGVPSADGQETDLASADNTIVIAQRGAPSAPAEALAARAAGLPRAMLPYLDAILALRFDASAEGIVPLADPLHGQDDVLVLW